MPTLSEMRSSQTKLEIIDKIKSKFIQKYGRDNSPVISKCVDGIMERPKIETNDLHTLEAKIKE